MRANDNCDFLLFRLSEKILYISQLSFISSPRKNLGEFRTRPNFKKTLSAHLGARDFFEKYTSKTAFRKCIYFQLIFIYVIK